MTPTPICFAHRGASGYEPENSMASFQRAISLGSSWIELDVQSVEGCPIVFHDRDLKRTTGDTGLIASTSLDHIRGLTLANGEKIPLLREVLTKFMGKVSLQIELKGFNIAKTVSLELSAALSTGWSPSELRVSSFDHEELLEFHNLQPDIPIGALFYGYPLKALDAAKKLGATSVHIKAPFISSQRIKAFQNEGIQVFVYTVNDDSEIQRMISLGVDGIFTDYPDKVLALTKTQL